MAVRPAKKTSLHDMLLQGIEDLVQKQDLLIVKLLVTNSPVIELEFGSTLASKAIKELEVSFSNLNSIAFVGRVSKVLFEIRAKDASNQLGFIRQIRSIVNDVNSSKRYRFLLETSLGAVVTDHKANLSSKDWDARLNLALMKSTRTGRPEIADTKVATSEQVRHELSRLGPGSPPPEGMHWVFQPINYVATGEVFGYEALCRWDSPTLGSISPEMFIQIAEDLNLVQIIDFWTLKSVEASYPELLLLGGQAISINISAQTLGNDHEFFSAVDQLLPKIKEAHFSLIFELTETSVIENQIDLSLGLIGLRKRGAKIAIDDFGTGKTSLSIISSLPTDFVKLDGSLLEVERPDLSVGLLELGMKFAELVGAEVIVEKVETHEDLELARKVGAKYAQGWLFGQPVDLSLPTPTQL
ncbi:MAG: EAL domain-containing protein [Actinomycetota bacterium]|jgi:EAL domain-containing protein (putative c-di-GMP-specific phosphodiesterase class I)|nr:EAL domain-containing protein [Actinomycetota bacterium]